MKTVAVETPEPQVRTLPTIAHFPLLDVRVKPEPWKGQREGESQQQPGSDKPEAVAVNDAQVPVVNQVPPLMIQPSWEPFVVTDRVPLPEGVPGVRGEDGGVVGGEGLDPLPLGRYLIPVVGQSDLDPSKNGGKLVLMTGF